MRFGVWSVACVCVGGWVLCGVAVMVVVVVVAVVIVGVVVVVGGGDGGGGCGGCCAWLRSHTRCGSSITTRAGPVCRLVQSKI